MYIFKWDNEKNAWLKLNRGVCFEDVVLQFDREEILEIIDNPNQKKYPNQKLAVINLRNYIHLVPYVQDGDDIFLKTIIPSRKATKKYLGSNYEKNET